jgi:hypothetical protein
MKLRLTATVPLLALMGALVLGSPGAAASPANPNPFTDVPASGTGTDGVDFLGTLNVLEFAVLGDELFAVGTLSGQLSHTVDNVAVPVTTVKSLPVTAAVTVISATCDTLDLVLGPVPPEPLGFAIAVNPIHLEGVRTADSGEGTVELACSIAGLLESGAPLHLAGELLNPLLESLG